MWYRIPDATLWPLSAIKSCLIGNRFALAISIVPIYEYLATLDQEVATIWQRKLTWYSALLLFNRWTMVLQGLFNTVGTGSLQLPVAMSAVEKLGVTLTCRDVILAEEIFASVGFLLVSAFSALRIFALYNRNRFLFSIILAPALLTVGFNAFFVSRLQYSYLGPPLYACMAEVQMPPTFNRIIVIVTRIPVLIADGLVLWLTWAKTYHHVQEAKKAGIHMPIVACLISGGTVYFVSVFLIHVVQLAVANAVPDALRLGGTFVGAFVYVLPQVLVNRFMLSLRRIGEQFVDSAIGSTETGTMRFGTPATSMDGISRPSDEWDSIE